MSQDAPTYRGTSAAVVLLLKVARESGVIINRVKLAKLLYLADVRAVAEDLPPGTDVEWRWRHYGPHSNALQEIESDLCAARVIQAERSLTFYGNKEIRFRLLAADPRIDVNPRFMNILGDVVSEFGHLSATQLRDLAYQSPPMLAAIAKGRREVRLDLTGGEPYPDLAPALARLKAVARSMPAGEDEDGGIVDLKAELEEWAETRRSATSQLVDE